MLRGGLHASMQLALRDYSAGFGSSLLVAFCSAGACSAGALGSHCRGLLLAYLRLAVVAAFAFCWACVSDRGFAAF